MKNWYGIIPPHADIRKGGFDEAVFAADLGAVASQAAPDDYRDPFGMPAFTSIPGKNPR